MPLCSTALVAPADVAPAGQPASAAGAPSCDAARTALETTCLTVKRIAAELGMPRATLEAYRLGTRRMPTHARVRLGAYLAARAEMLNRLADELGTAESA